MPFPTGGSPKPTKHGDTRKWTSTRNHFLFCIATEDAPLLVRHGSTCPWMVRGATLPRASTSFALPIIQYLSSTRSRSYRSQLCRETYLNTRAGVRRGRLVRGRAVQPCVRDPQLASQPFRSRSVSRRRLGVLRNPCGSGSLRSSVVPAGGQLYIRRWQAVAIASSKGH